MESVLTIPPALSSLHCVSVGRLLSFSESQLYHQKNRRQGIERLKRYVNT